MPEVSKHSHGAFSCVDQGSSDQKTSVDFYTRLFGWEVDEVPIGNDQVYSQMFLGGKAVAAVGPQQQPGMPVVWNSYISVDDVDQTATAIQEAGGQIIAEPLDVFDAGRMTVAMDPTGAFVSFWQAGTSIGAEIIREAGSISWNELATRDIEQAKQFYSDIVGWEYDPLETAQGGTYWIAKIGDEQVGGLMAMEGTNWPSDIPSHWDVYFEVDDCDATCAKAKELGAQVHMEPSDLSGVGRFAFLQDPVGAYFYVIKSAAQQS